nr:phospholipase-like protein [Tanacetum cinerariifolium]
MTHELRLKREAVEKAFEVTKEKDRTIMHLEEMKFLAISMNDLSEDDAVFPDKIAEPLKKVRDSEHLELIIKPKIWSALSDEDSVKKDSLVISCDLAWLKTGNFEKGDYGALFVEWSNSILCMALTSTELLQPWLIRSMDYFRTLLVDGQPNGPIIASPGGDGDPSIVLKELATVNRLPTKLFNTQLNLLKERTESSISDVFHGELSVVETLKNEALSKEYDKNVDDSGVGKTGEEEIHLDGLETVDDPFVQTPNKQNSEVNMVNDNQLPLSEMVVGQLIRKRFVGKDLVEPYTMQPPVTARSTFLKVYMKRLKRKERLLQIQNIRISFDDDVGDDDQDFKVLSLEEWESTNLKKQNKKEPIRQSQIALEEIPLVEFHEGNNEIFVYRSFWLNLLGLKEGGWLLDRVFFSINEPKKHYCLGVLHIRTGVITLYGSLFSKAVETRKWWIKMRKTLKKYIPPYLQEWGILDAKGIPLESYNINLVV